MWYLLPLLISINVFLFFAIFEISTNSVLKKAQVNLTVAGICQEPQFERQKTPGSSTGVFSSEFLRKYVVISRT